MLLMSNTYSVYFELPQDFISPVEASVCVCEHDQQILLLKRHPQKWEGNTWNVPGGKIDPGETPFTAALRETYEEARILLDTVEHMKTIYIRTDKRDNVWHIFRSSFDVLPNVRIREEEAVDFVWKTVEEAYALPLIMGG